MRLDRIYTTPNPAVELKRLFPGAAAFSPLAGEPLHFIAYGADPKTAPSAPPLGVAFWTTTRDPQMLQILLRSARLRVRYDASRRDAGDGRW